MLNVVAANVKARTKLDTFVERVIKHREQHAFEFSSVKNTVKQGRFEKFRYWQLNLRSWKKSRKFTGFEELNEKKQNTLC